MRNLKTIITVDVENPQTPLIQGKFKDNRIWSNGWGIEKIIKVFDQYNLQGDFFVNVYEYKIWGRSELNKIVRYIYDRGHNVHLHTHPYWIDSKGRENMFQFTYQEQRNIIKLGKEFIQNAIPILELAHRAGAYGFNQATLESCIDNKIFIDSSNFYGHKFCRFILTKNDITEYKALTEVPVTCSLSGNKYIKTDLDWMDVNFIKDIYLKENPGLINLFMHSYSFTETSDAYTSFIPSENQVQKLITIIDYLKTIPNNQFSTIFQFKE